MNDAELQSRIQAIRSPARSDEYWEEFSSRVMSQLPRSAALGPVKDPWFPAFAWGMGLAMACVVIGFVIGKTDGPLLTRMLDQEQKMAQRLQAVPQTVCGLIQSENGKDALETP